MSGYPVPATRHEHLLKVRRSRFLSTVDYAPTVEAAKTMIAELRAAHPRATHHVHAFAVGHGATTVKGMTDDGEPSGTAGPPTLTRLEASGLGDACIVTVRWFGGTKLGTGGLAAAYGAAAAKVLEGAQTTVKTTWRRARIRTPYALLDPVQRALTGHGAQVVGGEYGVNVLLDVRVPEGRVNACQRAVADLSAGRVRVEAE